MDLLKDYDCEIKYHPSSANLTADDLSCKVRLVALHTIVISSVIQDCCELRFILRHNKGMESIHLATILSEPSLFTRIRDAQISDSKTHRLACLVDGDSTICVFIREATRCIETSRRDSGGRV